MPRLRKVRKRPEEYPDFSKTLKNVVDFGSIRPADQAWMMRHIEASAKAGYDPSGLARALGGILHAEGRGLNRETAAKKVRKILEMKGEQFDRNRLGEDLGSGFRSGTLDERRLDQITPVLKSSAKAGHDPANIGWVLKKGLRTGAFYDGNITAVSKELTRASKRKRDASGLARVLSVGIESGVIEKNDPSKAARAVGETLERTADAGHDPLALVSSMEFLLGSKKLTQAQFRAVHEEIDRLVREGKDPSGLTKELHNALGRRMITPGGIGEFIRNRRGE